MVEQIVWQERFNMGVDILDKEHKKLITIINRLFAATKDNSKNRWICQEGIKYFNNHATKHFKEEEQYMRYIDYDGYLMHKRIHDNFRDNTLPGLEKELNQTDFSTESVIHFLGVCSGWLLGHTLTEDLAITGKVSSKWKHLIPEEENYALSQAIAEALYGIFRIKVNVISESYGGEKFGNGIYYRMVYTSKHGDRWEVFFVFEEKVLLNTTALLMGMRYDVVNATLINNVRYMSQQLMESIKGRFPNIDMFEMKEENLLSYEQFNRIFKREHPRCSLLFDSGEGYFAFCVLTPHNKTIELGTGIKAENAMFEINKYISSMKVSTKKKILVVDDSSTIRMFLENLLAADYEIQMADSGLSAFRSIILNKPDLVLLDYEMPVCDGRQVLEMIRKEKDFADTPVIFLTGKGDVESVSKVMSLNPEGYLLKTMKPTEIKKSIEVFFKKKDSEVV